MWRNADRAVPLLGKAGIIDDQKGILAADQPVGLSQKGRLQRCAVPDPVGNKVVQLVITDRRIPRGHRQHALAITWAYQSSDVSRAHPRPCLMPERRNKRRQPVCKIVAPILHK